MITEWCVEVVGKLHERFGLTWHSLWAPKTANGIDVLASVSRLISFQNLFLRGCEVRQGKVDS